MLSRSLKKLSVIGTVLMLTACGDPQLKLGEEVYSVLVSLVMPKA
jgi:hypothetical protein